MCPYLFFFFNSGVFFLAFFPIGLVGDGLLKTLLMICFHGCDCGAALDCQRNVDITSKLVRPHRGVIQLGSAHTCRTKWCEFCHRFFASCTEQHSFHFCGSSEYSQLHSLGCIWNCQRREQRASVVNAPFSAASDKLATMRKISVGITPLSLINS